MTWSGPGVGARDWRGCCWHCVFAWEIWRGETMTQSNHGLQRAKGASFVTNVVGSSCSPSVSHIYNYLSTVTTLFVLSAVDDKWSFRSLFLPRGVQAILYQFALPRYSMSGGKGADTHLSVGTRAMKAGCWLWFIHVINLDSPVDSNRQNLVIDRSSLCKNQKTASWSTKIVLDLKEMPFSWYFAY